LSITAKSLIITSIRAFKGNPHDSKTIEPVLNGHIQYTGSVPEELIFDRGGRGKKQIRETKICIPGKPLKKDTAYQRRKKRKRFRRRAAIELVIGHLKKDFRMIVNYLWGEDSPIINAMLAATGWNLKKMMEKLKKEFFLPGFFHLIKDWYIKNSLPKPISPA